MSVDESDGVWSRDIEEAFEEALAIYPPCGRRKIILSDEGKMFGRNELIARYIKMRTGKSRSRKQVSSHIQVLARKKQRDLTVKLKENCDEETQKAVLDNLTSMSSAQIVSATMSGRNKQSHFEDSSHNNACYLSDGENSTGLSRRDSFDHSWDSENAGPHFPLDAKSTPNGYSINHNLHHSLNDSSMDSSILQYNYDRFDLKLVDFSAFLEYRLENTDSYHKHMFCLMSGPNLFGDSLLECVDIRQIYDKFPGIREKFSIGPKNSFFLVKFWADLSVEYNHGFYGISSKFVADTQMNIKCSTKVCSFGKQVVEKLQSQFATPENGKYSYNYLRSPMCEYMISFIEKLKALENKEMMNSVLENFSVLQTVINEDTQESLFCIAYVFEISSAPKGSQYNVYRLVE